MDSSLFFLDNQYTNDCCQSGYDGGELMSSYICLTDDVVSAMTCLTIRLSICLTGPPGDAYPGHVVCYTSLLQRGEAKTLNKEGKCTTACCHG